MVYFFELLNSKYKGKQFFTNFQIFHHKKARKTKISPYK